MNVELKTFIDINKEEIDQRLPVYIDDLHAPKVLKEAMTYSLKAGGKRIRPLLLLATLQSFHKPLELGYDVACALEMIHTYSLIHDDLPAMDDDDLRRGLPTNHKVYGEAIAILAGDALLTLSMEVVAKVSSEHITAEQKLLIIEEIARAAGPEGMVGGQVADLEGENKTLSLDELTYIHDHKTGDLLTASIICGAILAGASNEDVNHLRLFARELGLLFQIRDDILDVEGDTEKLGKRVGSDDDNNKSTYPNLLGLEGAKEKLVEHKQRAKEYLYKVTMDQTLLQSLTDYIADRDH